MPDEKLEDEVENRESKGFMRKAFDLGFNTLFATGATAFGIATTGTAGLLIGGALGGGAFIGGLFNKEKSFYQTTYDAIKTYGALNTVLYPMIWLGDATFPWFDYSSKIASAAAKTAYSLTAYLGVFLGLFKGTSHLIDNKLNPVGIGQTLSQDFWPEYRRLAFVFAPGLALVANGVPAPVYNGLEIPWFASNALPAGIYNNYNPPIREGISQKTEPEPKQARAQAPVPSQPQLAPSPG